MIRQLPLPKASSNVRVGGLMSVGVLLSAIVVCCLLFVVRFLFEELARAAAAGVIFVAQ
jgi:hypothetical protein